MFAKDKRYATEKHKSTRVLKNVVSYVLVAGTMLSVVSAGSINTLAIGADKVNFIAEEGKKEKSYVIITENQKIAEQIEEVFATENEMVTNSNAQESDLNS